MGQGILSDVCMSAVYPGPDTIGYTDYSFIFRKGAIQSWVVYI